MLFAATFSASAQNLFVNGLPVSETDTVSGEVTKVRIVGLSVGYTAKRLVSDDYKGPWIGGGEDGYWLTSPALKIGFYWAPEFRYE